MTYQEIIHRLQKIYDNGEAKAIARMLLEERFGLSMTDIICGKTEELSAEEQQELENIVERLERNEPLQYVLGYADFLSYRFHVAPGVLIPRPETEELVQRVVDAASRLSCPHILDIGTGSGCIAIASALELTKRGVSPHVEAWDISPDALSIARQNNLSLHADICLYEVDVLGSDLKTDRQDIIVSNPPYICESEKKDMESNVTDHEPHLALFVPDNDPLLFYRRIAEYAAEVLNSGGWLMFEINRAYGREVSDMLRSMNFSDVSLAEDQFANPRIVTARKP